LSFSGYSIVNAIKLPLSLNPRCQAAASTAAGFEPCELYTRQSVCGALVLPGKPGQLRSQRRVADQARRWLARNVGLLPLTPQSPTFVALGAIAACAAREASCSLVIVL
jgi:hypothetical protein